MFILNLASNESEAEEDKVDKPARKNKKGRKKARGENEVGFSLNTSDCNNRM